MNKQEKFQLKIIISIPIIFGLKRDGGKRTPLLLISVFFYK